MNYILFDDQRRNFLPFTYTRPVSEIRCGILSLTEKWERVLGVRPSFLTETYLQGKFPCRLEKENTYINGTVFPDDSLLEEIQALEEGELLYHQDHEKIIAFRSQHHMDWKAIENYDFVQLNYEKEILDLNEVWDIFSKNGLAITRDFELLTKGRKSQALDSSNQHIGTQLFVEEGAKISAAILKSSSGPIYIGKNAEVMEGAVIRGPFSLGESSTVKMGAKIYGPTSIGPESKVGGEVNNSVIFGYSNKGHDGFLGNSVLGEWCNLGADTNVSNLKNNYAEIKIWNYDKQGFKRTGLQFCGLMMGDHSKSGINSMFNTATVVGVSANVFGAGFPRTFVPSFAWGGAEKWAEFKTDKAYEVAERMMERRGIAFGTEDRAILDHVFELSKEFRRF